MAQGAHSAETILEIIREHIIRTHGELPEPVELDTQLLGTGLVDSFGLVDIGLEIARTFNVPMKKNFLPEDFETPNALWTRVQELTGAG